MAQTPNVVLHQASRQVPLSITKPGIEVDVINGQLSRPLGNRLRASVICDVMIGALIRKLLSPSRPIAILMVVWPVVPATVNRMSAAWPGSHITKEVLERITPAVAHEDAPPTVIVKVRDVRRVATRLHVLPDTVFRGGTSPTHMTVGGCSPSALSLQASARLGTSRLDRSPLHGLFCAAYASTHVIRAAVHVIGSTNDGQSLVLISNRYRDVSTSSHDMDHTADYGHANA